MNKVVRGLVAVTVSIGAGVTGIPAGTGAVVQGSALRATSQQARGDGGGLSPAGIGALVARLRGAGTPEQIVAALGTPHVRAALAAGDLARAAGLARAAVTAGQQGTSGLITGSVRLPDGRPLAGACAVAVGPAGARVAVTGSNGQFSIAGLPAGAYTVRYSGCAAPGRYLPRWYSGPASGWSTVLGGTGLTRQSATTVAVRSGAPAALPAVTMRPAGSPAAVAWAMASAGSAATQGASTSPAAKPTGRYAGVVTNKHGRPLPGICLITADRAGKVFFFTKTNSTGAYQTPAMPPDKYLALFLNCRNPGNFAPQFYKNAYFDNADPVTVTAGKVIRNINVALKPGATIAGTTTAAAPASTPIANVCVQLAGTGTADIFSGFAISDASGHFRVRNLATGTYMAQFEPGCKTSSVYAPIVLGRGIHATDGRVNSGVHAVLPVGGTISGAVTAGWSGQPLGGICVIAVDLNSFAEGQARSASDGSYTVTGLPTGSFVVGFAGCGKNSNVVTQFYDAADSPITAQRVTVTLGSATTGIDAAMQQGGTVTGLVTDAARHPLPGICVQLFSMSPDSAPTGGTGADGRFSITGIPPGQYFVDFTCGFSRHYVDTSYSSPADPGITATVAVSSGVVTSGVNARLRLSGMLSGTVTNRAGKPIPKVCAIALGAHGLSRTNAGVGLALTSKTGHYTMIGLPAGQYRVVFFGCFGGTSYASQWYKGQAHMSKATLVRVRSQATTSGIDAKLVIGGTIAGRASSAVTHGPASGVLVLAEGPGIGNVAVTNKQGDFLIKGLATGTYSLFYEPGGNLVAAVGSHQVHVVQGQAARAVGVTLHLGGAIAGTVLAGSPTRPAVESCVLVVPSSGPGQEYLAVTGGHGRYQQQGIAPGTYDVYLGDPACGADGTAPQWYSDVQSRLHATAVTVKAGQVAGGIGGTLHQDGTLSGTVTDSGSQPIAGICATVYPVSADPLGGAATLIVATTAADGTYSVPDVVPGRYKVEFSSGCGASGYALRWYLNATSRATASFVSVGVGAATTGIDGVLAKG